MDISEIAVIFATSRVGFPITSVNTTRVSAFMASSKVDKSFISKLGNKSDDALCEAIILMAHKLGIKVVAEGVEREDQYQKLKQISCDYAQGYYLSKPLTMEKLQNLIKERLSHKTA